MTLWTYTLGIPNGPNNPSNDQPNMKVNNDNIENLISVDHVGFNVNNGGYHTDIHMVPQGGDPAALPGFGQLYSKTSGGDQELFFESGGGVITQLTGGVAPSPNPNGFTFLPGGILLQWGTVAPTNATPVTVTYPKVFPSGNPAFSINFSTSSATIPGTQWAFWLVIGASTSSNFQIYNNSTHTFGYNWMAIGN